MFLLINLTLNVCVNVFLYFLAQLHREAKHVLWVTAAGPLNNKSQKLDSKERLKRYYVNFIIHLPRVFLYLTSDKSVSKTGKNQPQNDCLIFILFYIRISYIKNIQFRIISLGSSKISTKTYLCKIMHASKLE